ncbi:MAG: hypothetical protein Q4F21_07400 [Lachnospiraceae bacterium]|nr:hypothetical protein [Lachnospiraceae bacterium]
MRWYDALWVGRKAARKKRRIISAVKNRERMAGVYLITLAQNPSELLDIIPSGMLASPAFPADELFVLGIAAGRQEAFELVEKMVDYIYRETNALDIRSYFSEKLMNAD